jgi:DNA polymerase I-like protein with 3'-5' exonuclease and polymerase domains
MNLDYVLVERVSDLEDCIQELNKSKDIALDTETYQDPTKPTSPYGFSDPHTNKIRLVQLKSKTSPIYLIDLKVINNQCLELLKNFLSQEDKVWVIHNAKFDYKMIKVNLEVSLINLWDTMIASQLIGHACGTNFGKARGHGLKAVLRDFLSVEINKNEQASYWGGALTPEQYSYAAHDVLHILELKNMLNDVLVKPYPEGYGMAKATQDEMALVSVLGDIEINGVAFDLEVFKLVQAAAKATIPSLVERICKNFGIGIQKGFMGVTPAINLDSVPQLMEMLKKNNIEVESTESDVLEEASKIYPKLVDLIEYKKLQKSLSFPYGDWINPVTGRLHPSYNQLGAGTSRLSCNEPNLQQVPKITLKIPQKLIDPEKHKIFYNKKESEKSGKDTYTISYRSCFSTEAGNRMINCDFSGQELCIVASMSEDKLMCHILSQPELKPDGSKNPEADLHSIAANGMFPEVAVADIANGATDSKGVKYRDYGKILNFSTIYGKTAEGYAKDWGIDTKEAKKILKGYFTKFPGLAFWLENVSEIGEKTRLSMFPEGFPEARYRFLNDNGKSDAGAISRASKNSPVQGTGAIMVKQSLVQIKDKFKNKPLKFILTVHDEIGFEAPVEYAEEFRSEIKSIMESVANYFLKGLVPGRVDAKIGNTWQESH